MKTKKIFSSHGIPQGGVSDNGTQNTAQEYQKFAKEYGFQHTTISPTHPQSNGLAEKTPGTVKSLLTKCRESGQDFYLALLEYCNTPIDVIGSPSQLLMSCELRSILPVMQKQ